MPEQKIRNFLSSAQGENSRERAVAYLREALLCCENWFETERALASLAWKILIKTLLPFEISHPQERAEAWLSVLSTNLIDSQISEHPQIIFNYANAAVDCFQDQLSSLSPKQKTDYLRRASKTLESLDFDNSTPHTRAQILQHRSMILRNLALIEVSPRSKKSKLNEAFRAAQRAQQEDQSASITLELALSQWAIARYADSDLEYKNILQSAETNFRKSLCQSELARLTLARFLRMTYSPLPACHAFRDYAANALDKRRLLRSAHVYGESATQLW